jgi:lysophospholipase L1-like esterase
LAWRYTKKAIVYMCEVARRHDAHFAIVPITPNTPRYGDILRRFAAAAGIDFVDTSALTMAEAPLWLPGDGHFSPLGARRFAERAAAYVAAHAGGSTTGGTATAPAQK